ncbi:acyl-CoA dehydrogenase family protein [Rhodococcus sp. SORGH_AS_0301]|uniref:acyl-CoA dehydrogenase family protein n=1 Tax=Rhodococcus sp. SORGH_AS_0301 TaxID=3041780 RepID=UPI00277D46CE|nr:acyl-CoA dehydrogenase family protein [Rhodococcus sp. SORGH_AS_0301]MDQ1178578.1 alkylation response protein AidB-like acyl-CoA dehydrogenase [Rhodococcus sp. SORGH_AS_0301]
MPADVNTELQFFLDSTRTFLERRGSIPTVRAMHAEGSTLDRAWWSQAAELGWTMLLAPASLGGDSPSGEGLVDLAAVAELTGAHAAPGPLNSTSAVIAGFAHADAEAGHDDTIESILSGERVAAWAVHAPGPAWRPFEPAVRAERTTDGQWRLDGEIRSVEFGAEADVLLVVARTGDSVAEFLVPTDHANVAVRARGSVDFVRNYADVSLVDLQLPTEALVVAPDNGVAVVSHQMQVMNVLQVAEAVGAMGKVFDLTLQWAFDRFSFGRPLASYQALKHRYADAALAVHASRAVLAAAVRATQHAHPDAAKVVSAAKAFVGESSVRMMQDCCQLHGGISQTMEHDLHLFLRRAMVAREMYGSPREHRSAIADIVFEEKK